MEQKTNENHHCSECAWWCLGFDNSCIKRTLLLGDDSSIPGDTPACEEWFEPEEL